MDLVNESYRVRRKYVKHCFPILSDEFLKSLSGYCREKDRIVDLCCGEGWLSHWLGRYGVGVTAVDRRGHEFFSRFLPEVQKCDALKYIRKNRDVDAYILSWPPYNKPLAANIWKELFPGQELLYIGEGSGGCTADDRFFSMVKGHMVEDKWGLNEGFRSFYGIHDRPMLFRK